MTRDEFAGPAQILDGAFPGEFTPADEEAYYFILDDYTADQVLGAIKAWRQKWRPAASELREILESERGAGVPTADELILLLDSFLSVHVRGRFEDEAAREAAVRAERQVRLERMHPLAASFLQRHGKRFHGLSLVGEDGKWNRKELFEAWAVYVAAMEGREVAVLAAGTGREGLRALDPLAALSTPPESARLQLPSGER